MAWMIAQPATRFAKRKVAARILAGHLQRQQTCGPRSRLVRCAYTSPHLRTCRLDLWQQAQATNERQAGQEEQTLGVCGGERALAFASRTKTSPRSFAALSGT